MNTELHKSETRIERIENIVSMHPDVRDIRMLQVELPYSLKGLRNICKTFCTSLLLLQPIITIKDRYGRYVCVGNRRILQLACLVFGVEKKIPILVIDCDEKFIRCLALTETVACSLIFTLKKDSRRLLDKYEINLSCVCTHEIGKPSACHRGGEFTYSARKEVQVLASKINSVIKVNDKDRLQYRLELLGIFSSDCATALNLMFPTVCVAYRKQEYSPIANTRISSVIQAILRSDSEMSIKYFARNLDHVIQSYQSIDESLCGLTYSLYVGAAEHLGHLMRMLSPSDHALVFKSEMTQQEIATIMGYTRQQSFHYRKYRRLDGGKEEGTESLIRYEIGKKPTNDREVSDNG